MKKTLALVLALLMVLALVPTAFAADEYKVTAEVDLVPNFGSVESYKNTFTASGTAPDVVVEVPYGAIKDQPPEDIWSNSVKHIDVTIAGFPNANTATSPFYGVGSYKLEINGDYGETYTWNTTDKKWEDSDGKTPAFNPYAGDTVSFTAKLENNSKSTYKFEVKLSAYTNSDCTGLSATKEMTFYISYRDTTKPVYELKFGQASGGAYLKDGVYFIDSANSNIASSVDKFQVNVLKNDGSKFADNENARYGEQLSAYPGLGQGHLDYKVVDSQIDIFTKNLKRPKNEAVTVYVVVETATAFYKGTLTYKYRTDVWNIDPKGVFFDKDEYIIGVNEVFTPSYTTTVPVWHDVAGYITLSQTANTEKGIVDCDNTNKTIIGLREGVAYVMLEYTDNDMIKDGVKSPVTYTDTVKVTVKGTYQVTDKANYIVTTSSSNLNVRSGAGTKYSKIGSLAKGTVVEVVEIKDGWAKIIFPSAKYTNGYVSAQYLTKQSTSPETVIGEKTVCSRVLNVRSGAGTSYSIVGKLNRNTKVEVIETVANGSWSKIKFNGGYAYVSSTYIQ